MGGGIVWIRGLCSWSDGRDTLRKEEGRRRETDNCNRWQREGGGEGEGERGSGGRVAHPGGAECG